MQRNINNIRIGKDYILSKVSSISIFAYYFNISPDLIQWCISNNELILSPIRDDNHPTFGFKYDKMVI